MIRALLIIVLLALASCDAVYAEELTVTAPATAATTRQADQTPQTISALALLAKTTGTPGGQEFGYCDSLAPYPYETTIPMTRVPMLVGATWRLLMVGEDTPQVDYTGFTFILYLDDEEVTSAIVTGGAGTVDITLPAAQTLAMDGVNGVLFLWIIDPTGVNPFTTMSIPFEFYPTYTRLL